MTTITKVTAARIFDTIYIYQASFGALLDSHNAQNSKMKSKAKQAITYNISRYLDVNVS